MPDTIFALSSGQLPSGVAVLRLSGPASRHVCEILTGSVPKPRYAAYRSIRDRNEDIIDEGLVLFFAAPHSFTGEDCLELQVHGSRAVLNRLLALLSALDGMRPAEAGEFTRRAFENGKLDLLEIEGLSDLIVAETEMQRRLAQEHSHGHLSAFYTSCSDRLTRCRALIEAELDFADEADVPGSVSDQVWRDVSEIESLLKQHLQDAQTGERIRDGLKVVIAGKPNVGKSSLMNALAKRDVAITTEIAGTTRDLLQVDLDIRGFAVRLIDTAGLRTTDDVVEQEGVRRATAAIEAADIVLSLSDDDDFSILSDGLLRTIRVRTKSDQTPSTVVGTHDIAISTRTGDGLTELLDLLVRDLDEAAKRNQLAIPSRIRHVTCLRDSVAALELALAPHPMLELRAEALRQASNALGRITGSVDVEDLLDVIFREFCIGK